MAHLDYTKAQEDFKAHVLKGIREHFPVKGSLQTLELEDLEIPDASRSADDIQGQYAVKVKGGDWSVPVYGTVVLKKADGTLVDRKRMRLAEMPMLTRRHSYILDGQEKQVDNQWQLMPGVYTRRMNDGTLETRFNTPNTKEFRVTFDPASKQFLMARGGTKVIPVYPLMKALGVDDDSIQSMWGNELFDANKNAAYAGNALERFYKADHKGAPPTKNDALEYFRKKMEETTLRPEVTTKTLGKPFTSVDGDTFLRATKRLLDVHGGAPEDDRDSLEFKDLRTAGDFVLDRLQSREAKSSIRSKMTRKVNFATDAREVVRFDTFNRHIRQAFTEGSLARSASQVNPIDMLSSAMQTTVMGPGGIQSQQAVSKMVGLKLINPSHLGYLDPVKTPEGDKTGVTLYMPIGVEKVGNTPKIPLYNMATGKQEMLSPVEFGQAVVAMPDQVKWDSGKPKFIGNTVKASVKGNEIGAVKSNTVQYAMRHPSQLFSITTNLIPFLSSTSGNRATYGGQFLDQAISLKDREAPMVQVSTGSDVVDRESWERILGRHTSHLSPVGGKVTSVTKDLVKVRTEDNKVHNISLYNNFPTNDKKGLLHSTPTVKSGDVIKAGQHVADTNFTKGGTLALGTNLRVAYIPYKGYNFEDGVVISESAAKRLTSEHMHKPSLRLDDGMITDPKRFMLLQPGAFTKDQYTKIGTDGIVQVGTKVLPGDPLVLAARPYQLKDKMSADALRKVMDGVHNDASLRWEAEHPGEVVAAHRNAKGDITLHVRTLEPMQVGDKLSGRFGNKGIVTLVVPDKEMPHTKDGKHMEVLLNPSGVPGRMNPGQVFETAAAKIVEKTGKSYIVDSFSQGSALEKVKTDLKKHGISDTDELLDPKTGLSLGQALTGKQYLLKLEHQVDKKATARGGMVLSSTDTPEHWSRTTLIPSGGGKTGGQSMGTYGIFSLLAHGARANIREMQTWKSEGEDPTVNPAKRWNSQHADVWAAIQSGSLVPPPRPTFTYRKFEDMLLASGVNVEKKGNGIQLNPLTNGQILAMSNGEVKEPSRLTYAKIDKTTGELKTRTGGLFDDNITGGIGGKKWSHIKLPEPVPNPVFAGPIQKLTGLKEKEYESIVNGDMALKDGKLVALDTPGSIAGGNAIKTMLDGIDTKKALAKAEKDLSGMSVPEGQYTAGGRRRDTPKVDKLVKQVKYLRALDQLGVNPAEAYMLHNVPVLPPIMRQPSVLQDGAVRWEDVNGLYQQLGQMTTELPHLLGKLPDADLKKFRANVYDCVAAIQGLGTPVKESKNQGLLRQIAGSDPKHGFFQKQLLNRKQDLTMRSTIVPEPSLGLDEVGLPREEALRMYRPFVVKKLVDMGVAQNPVSARKLVEEAGPSTYQALNQVVTERPVILKRDPALHLHSVQAFKPRIIAGKAIQIHPLVTGGFNADFDGDTMSAYVPVSNEAVAEARKMMPSNSLFNVATGRVVYTPTLESALGLFKLSRIGQETKKTYADPSSAIGDVQAGKLAITDLVNIGGSRTTAGRVLLASALPEPMRKKILTDHDFVIDKKGLDSVFTDLAKNHKSDYGSIADRLKDMGNGASSGAVAIINSKDIGPRAILMGEEPKRREWVPVPVHTLSLRDFETDKALRDRHIAKADRTVNALSKSKLTEREREARTVEAYEGAAAAMTTEHLAKMKANPTNLAIMTQAGVKPSVGQYSQLVLAPMILEDASGKPVKTPVINSYSEGLDVAGYWTQMHGARGGSIKKVQEVQEPGYFSKQLMSTTIGMVVADHDCGTQRGISLPVMGREVHDRVLAQPFKAKGLSLSAGTVLTPDLVDQMRASDKHGMAQVRSTLKCEHGVGVCQKCAGIGHEGHFYDVGTNIGVHAAQSLGERAVQLTLKAFHAGGVRSAGGSKLLNAFDRTKQLTLLPENIPDSATLALRSGKIDRLENDATGTKVWIGGVSHHIGKDTRGDSLAASLLTKGARPTTYKPWTPPKTGMQVTAGQILSDPNRTNVNPHELYRATGNMEKVQNFLADELHGIYKDQGVRRQHIETVVSAMSQLTKVRDPGASHLIKGDFANSSKIRAMNKGLMRRGLSPVAHSPVLRGINVSPLQLQEDWMAKMMGERLQQTVLDAAATGAVSDLHGLHPIPGVAFGAEFGLTRKDSLRPGYKHLAGVPDYAY